jgi:hypothetical protein
LMTIAPWLLLDQCATKIAPVRDRRPVSSLLPSCGG